MMKRKLRKFEHASGFRNRYNRFSVPYKKYRLNLPKVHFNLDTDRDGVLDYRDCHPFDPRRQHRDPGDWMETEDPFPKIATKKNITGYTVYQTSISESARNPLHVPSDDIRDVIKTIKSKNYGGKTPWLFIIPGSLDTTKPKYLKFMKLVMENKDYESQFYFSEIGGRAYDKKKGKIVI